MDIKPTRSLIITTIMAVIASIAPVALSSCTISFIKIEGDAFNLHWQIVAVAAPRSNARHEQAGTQAKKSVQKSKASRKRK